MNTSTMASASTSSRSLERFLLLRVEAAVNDANRRRHIQAGHGLLHRLHSRAQAHAFEAARHRDRAVQILATDFGLARLHPRNRRATRGSRVLPVELLVIIVFLI